MQRQYDLDTFYELLAELEEKVGGPRFLNRCDGKMDWPERGVYFFFEPGECRTSATEMSRVVRVGTHALTSKSKTTLWTRLRQHRGTQNPTGGNHRGSIFRLLVGEALFNREQYPPIVSWGKGASASSAIRSGEQAHEMLVSDYVGAMPFLFLPVDDAPGHDSLRGVIERNSIALLSNYIQSSPDLPSSQWLGLRSGRDRVRRSGLWNNNHVDEAYDPGFLGDFRNLVKQM